MTIKPISGSWFEFQHPSTVEGVDWNATCACFTVQQWDAKIKEIAQVGREYLAKVMESFEPRPGIYTSPLVPARFERVLRQLGAVSPWVDKILVYQYQGMMNQPGSAACCGSPESAKLYTAYVNWLHMQGQDNRRS
jgi:hypothetical protein